MNRKGKTFIISGPSGVGKSTVLHALFEGRNDLYFSVSATTRAPREGERDGVDYHFIHADRFRSMIEEDAFLEYAEYVGNFYGTPKKYVDEAMEQGKDVILDIEVRVRPRSVPSDRRRCASLLHLPAGRNWSGVSPPAVRTRRRRCRSACFGPR